MNRATILCRVLFSIFLASNCQTLVFAQCQSPASGNTYLISTDLDWGPGSLRQAILDANSDNTGGTIEFAQGWFFTNFTVWTPLPAITCDSLVILDYPFLITIDGQNNVQGPGLLFNATSICLGSSVSGINFLPGTIMVTNINDFGGGSFRNAIQSSNFSNSADFIHFDIPGPAPHRIQVDNVFPYILYSVTIDGSTQPANGYSGSAPRIELDGVTKSFVGLVYYYNLTPHQYNMSLFGLYMHGFSTAVYTTGLNNVNIGSPGKGNVISNNNYGIAISQDLNVQVRNNFIGTDTSGTTAEGNVNNGLSIVGFPGGTYLIQNNVVSGNINDGIVLFNNVRNVSIKGNLIGTNKTGTGAIPNSNVGINSSATNLVIGGTQPGDGNLFSGNCVNSVVTGKAALSLYGDSAVIIGNKFGTNLAGTDTIPNRFGNSLILRGRKNRVGGPTPSERNIFAGSPVGIGGSQGVDNIIQNNYFGTDISGTISLPNDVAISIGSDSTMIVANKIRFNNTGIQLGGLANDNQIIQNEIVDNNVDGIWNWGIRNQFTQNAIYSNGNKGILNFMNGNNNIIPPMITLVSADSIMGTSVSGAVIELFNNLSGNNNPQGNQFLASVIADGSGNWKFTGSVSNPVNVTATQTDNLNNTSEFSELWPQVTTTVWPGDCNYDLNVDNLDFIYLGMAYGYTGPTRLNANLNWIAQPANDWSTEFYNGVNHKHSDTDGNGITDSQDDLAITQNYGQSHPFRYNQLLVNSAVYELKITALNSNVSPGSVASFAIEAGSSSLPIPALYGLKWTYLFNAALVDTNAVNSDYTISSIGNFPADAMAFEKTFFTTNTIDVAVTRINQSNTNNVSGLLGIIHLQTKPTINTIEILKLDIVSALGLTYSGIPISFIVQNDSVVIDPITVSIGTPTPENEIRLFPNPAKEIITLISDKSELEKISILDCRGKLVMTYYAAGHQFQFPVVHLPKGLLIFEIHTKDGNVSRERMLLN